MNPLTLEQKQAVAEDLLGTQDSIFNAMGRNSISTIYLVEIENYLMNIGIEDCPHCGRWIKSAEMCQSDSLNKMCCECVTYNLDGCI